MRQAGQVHSQLVERVPWPNMTNSEAMYTRPVPVVCILIGNVTLCINFNRLSVNVHRA